MLLLYFVLMIISWFKHHSRVYLYTGVCFIYHEKTERKFQLSSILAFEVNWTWSIIYLHMVEFLWGKQKCAVSACLQYPSFLLFSGVKSLICKYQTCVKRLIFCSFFLLYIAGFRQQCKKSCFVSYSNQIRLTYYGPTILCTRIIIIWFCFSWTL